ncbi:hypothetical protein P154DRAFT_347609 [Amniculicola lignicola CBS 123094]|uniref:Uncharacterized protein n=1 Tax=Amniculicola lignicola CBS 123094 TaxID=1392246 RepID=A0A6A5WCL5_9PLEO|nr:hypothetical protein P154DRAFT_347609 [Amniculicola lignicola CBS 123094]
MNRSTQPHLATSSRPTPSHFRLASNAAWANWAPAGFHVAFLLPVLFALAIHASVDIASVSFQCVALQFIYAYRFCSSRHTASHRIASAPLLVNRQPKICRCWIPRIRRILPYQYACFNKRIRLLGCDLGRETRPHQDAVLVRRKLFVLLYTLLCHVKNHWNLRLYVLRMFLDKVGYGGRDGWGKPTRF